jgi:hypothetical protein
MMNACTLAICTFGVVVLANTVEGQTPAQYRNFELKADLAAVSALTGVSPAEANTIHQRPALLQDLEWRPSRWTPGAAAVSTDPVEQIVFSFYNNQLYRLVVDYASERTEGMTDADMIEAISAVYGPTVKRAPGASRSAMGPDAESGAPVARWADVGHAVVLYKTSEYKEAFRLIVTEPALAESARTAGIQGTRLDAQDAPRREIARLEQEKEDDRAATDKARLANKVVFRP